MPDTTDLEYTLCAQCIDPEERARATLPGIEQANSVKNAQLLASGSILRRVRTQELYGSSPSVIRAAWLLPPVLPCGKASAVAVRGSALRRHLAAASERRPMP